MVEILLYSATVFCIRRCSCIHICKFGEVSCCICQYIMQFMDLPVHHKTLLKEGHCLLHLGRM